MTLNTLFFTIAYLQQRLKPSNITFRDRQFANPHSLTFKCHKSYTNFGLRTRRHNRVFCVRRVALLRRCEQRCDNGFCQLHRHGTLNNNYIWLMLTLCACHRAEALFKARLAIQLACRRDIISMGIGRSPSGIAELLRDFRHRGPCAPGCKEAANDLCRGLLWLAKNGAKFPMDVLKRTELLQTLVVFATGYIHDYKILCCP